jgi:Spy/CpxP family protein refolding chaperone
MEGHIAAAALLKGDDSDLAAYQAKLREMSEHMLQAQVGMARIAVQARAVLTPAQREAIPSNKAGDQSGMTCRLLGEAHSGAAGHEL